jgi:hypothetical protein
MCGLQLQGILGLIGGGCVIWQLQQRGCNTDGVAAACTAATSASDDLDSCDWLMQGCLKVMG